VISELGSMFLINVLAETKTILEKSTKSKNDSEDLEILKELKQIVGIDIK